MRPGQARSSPGVRAPPHSMALAALALVLASALPAQADDPFDGARPRRGRRRADRRRGGAAAGLHGDRRLQRPDQPDGRPLRARRTRVRRREERPHQGVRQPLGPDGDALGGPQHARSTTSGTAGCSASRSTRASRPGPTSTPCTPTTRRRTRASSRAGATAARRRPARPPTAARSPAASRACRRAASKQVLIEDFCQQYPSHSVGSLAFGADGALYVSARRRRELQLRRLRPGRQPAQPVR